jgi:ankyrin repeat protein
MRSLLLSSLLLVAFLGRPAFGGDIHEAVQKGDLETIRTLLAANPGLINAQTVLVGEWWLNGTPLHWGACAGRKDVVELLLDHHADVNARAQITQATPLHCAAGFGRTEVAELLLARGSAVEVQDKDQNTPLHMAAGNHDKALIELLLADQPRIFEKDKEGKMQQRVVMAWDVRGVVELLLASKAEVDARNRQGRTPLHMAAEFGNTSVIELLLSHGADIEARDKKRKTPLAVALDTRRMTGEREIAHKTERLRALGDAVDLLRVRGARE